jgi:imidazolonepropionase
MNVDLLIKTAGQLVTCASPAGAKRGAEMANVGVIDGGAVAVLDGRIAAVGNAADIEREHSASQTIDAGNDVVCPGFVDPHTHIVFAGDRLDEFELKIKGADYLDILAAGGGILSTVRNTRAASVDQLVEASRVRLDKMLECGTTTAEIKTGYGLDLETELKMLLAIERLDREHPIDIIPTFLAAHAVPPEFKGNSAGYVELICDEMLPAAWEWYENSHFFKSTPFFIDVFTEKNAFDLEESRRILSHAGELGYSIKAHVDEFTNLGGSRLAVEMGATSIDHLDAISDDEIELLAESNTVGIVTPTVNFNFGSSHFADARKLIDHGCSIAVSTDYNPGSAPCPSQPLAMAIACRYQKLLPAEAMNAVTINAAYAAGVGDRAGSIEVGKSADLLVLATSDYRESAYEFGGRIIRQLIKRGKVII